MKTKKKVKKKEDLEEVPELPAEQEEDAEEEESMFQKMTRLESEIADLQKEIDARNEELDKLEQVDVDAGNLPKSKL